MIFQEKYFSCYILSTDQSSSSNSFYYLRYCQMFIVIICILVCDVMKFEINLSFLEKFCYMAEKTKIKIQIFYEQKKILRCKKKLFFMIINWLSFARNCVRAEGTPVIFKFKNLTNQSRSEMLNDWLNVSYVSRSIVLVKYPLWVFSTQIQQLRKNYQNSTTNKSMGQILIMIKHNENLKFHCFWNTLSLLLCPMPFATGKVKDPFIYYLHLSKIYSQH